MKNFKPLNRHVAVAPRIQEVEQSSVLLPEDYKPKQEEYVFAEVLGSAPDCKIALEIGDSILIDSRMLQEIDIGSSTFSLILENYILGVYHAEESKFEPSH